MRATGSDTRQHILDAARPVVVGRGFAAVGLSEILAAAGVPKGSFYHHFGSKEQFGGELLAGYFEAYLAHVDEVLSTPGASAGERLLALFTHWHRTQSSGDLETRCLMVKLSAEVCDLSEPMRLALESGSSRVLERLARCIAEGRDAGELTAHVDPADVAQHLYQWWLGATLLARVQRRSDPLDAALRGTRAWLHMLREARAEQPG